MLVVPMNLPGIATEPRFDKLGMRSSDTTQVTFENVRIPRANVIGEVGKGFMYQMLQFQEERLFAAANILKPLDRAIAETAEYCRERKAFGGSLLSNQVVRFRLAELQTEVELLRALTFKCADAYIAGEDVVCRSQPSTPFALAIADGSAARGSRPRGTATRGTPVRTAATSMLTRRWRASAPASGPVEPSCAWPRWPAAQRRAPSSPAHAAPTSRPSCPSRSPS